MSKRRSGTRKKFRYRPRRRKNFGVVGGPETLRNERDSRQHPSFTTSDQNWVPNFPVLPVLVKTKQAVTYYR